ncbi:MAG TPA: hypothetical protein VG318_16980 [Actinomycetota bacterium]|nr:hypothetical protein [Actinomycetota bacterium]
MERGRRARGVGAVVAALISALTVAPPAAPAPLRSARAGLPRPIAAFLQESQQQLDTRNLMLAQFTRPRHKGYGWSVVAFKENASARTNLTISFVRSTVEDTQTQTSRFGWTLPKGALRMGPKLKPSSLVTGKGMGSNGRIALKLAGASQFVRLRNPGDCSGTISYREGFFRGTFRFDARDDYFGKITFPRTRVALYRADDLDCPEPQAGAGSCPPHLSLSAVDAESGVAVGAFKTLEGKVDQSVLVVGSSGKAKTAHRISVTVAAPESFDASDDMTTAHLDGDAGAPLLTGDLDYLAPPPPTPATDDCGAYQTTSGLATGDYTAHFDSIGPVTPATTGVEATLRREGA